MFAGPQLSSLVHDYKRVRLRVKTINLLQAFGWMQCDEMYQTQCKAKQCNPVPCSSAIEPWLVDSSAAMTASVAPMAMPTSAADRAAKSSRYIDAVCTEHGGVP